VEAELAKCIDCIYCSHLWICKGLSGSSADKFESFALSILYVILHANWG